MPTPLSETSGNLGSPTPRKKKRRRRRRRGSTSRKGRKPAAQNQEDQESTSSLWDEVSLLPRMLLILKLKPCFLHNSAARIAGTTVFLTCAEGRAIINIGSLPKGAVSATHVMVVTAQDHRCLQEQGRIYQSVVSTGLAGMRQRMKVGLLKIPVEFLHFEHRPTVTRRSTWSCWWLPMCQVVPAQEQTSSPKPYPDNKTAKMLMSWAR